MFLHNDIKGHRLPPRTLCLTYDDGPGETAGTEPGPRTRELARYLADQEIRATFFVVGRHVDAHPGVVEELNALGHIVGNHTMNHPGLVRMAEQGGDVVGEIAQAHARIKTSHSADPVFFRAPYGNWRQRLAQDGPDRATSVVASILNTEALAMRYVGPINWDISGEDFNYWRDRMSAEDCARGYLDEIESVGRGIVLMHDGSENPAMRAGNRAFETTAILVPALRARGYSFVGLDRIPQVRTAIGVNRVVLLQADDGSFLSLDAEDRPTLVRREPGASEQFGLADGAGDALALRAPNGLYLELDGAEVHATGASLNDRSLWIPEPACGDRFLLRIEGRYLSVDGGEATSATTALRRHGALRWTLIDLVANATEPTTAFR